MARKNSGKRNANGAGSIRKITTRNNGKDYTYWQARYTVGYDPGTGKQIQKSISGKTQAEVAQKLREITHDLDQGTYIAPCRMSLSEWLNVWKEEYLGNVKESTRLLYERNIEQYIVPHLGATRLEALTTPMIQAFYNDLLQPKKEGCNPLSPKTIKNVHGVLHRALQQAVLVGCLRNNPSDACILPRVIKTEIHPLDDDQISSFLDAIQGHCHEYLYKIALFTGLREGEVLGLSWDCVDLERKTLLVKRQLQREKKAGGKYYFSSPKNNKSRTLSLAPSVVQLFRLQKFKQNGMRLQAGDTWNESDLVFTNATGNCLSYRTVYDCFKRIVKKIGLPDVRFHDLRHTYAVLAIKSGDDIKTVQENLGHATATFTLDVYGHVTAQMKEKSADRMEKFIETFSQKSAQ